MRIAIFLFLLSNFSCWGQEDSKDSVQFHGIDSSYNNSDSIRFSISQRFSDTVFYYITLEFYDKERGRWRISRLDLDTPFSKALNSFPLPQGKEKQITYKHELPKEWKGVTKYRFKVNYGLSRKEALIKDSGNNKYSRVFKIRKE